MITKYKHPSGVEIPWDDVDGEPTEQDLDLAFDEISRSSTQQVPQQGLVNTGMNMMGTQNVNLGGKRAVGGVETDLAVEKTQRVGEVQNALDVQKEIGMQGVKPDTGEVRGRIALARESKQRIRNIKRSLFPDGTPKSFRRDLAFASNLPFLGKVGNVPFTEWDDEFVNDAGDLNRELGTILSGRQLIQTGVAARPEETQRLVQQFAPNVWSGPRAALNGLSQLEEFYDDYLKLSDPTGAKGFASIEDDSGDDPLGIR